MSEVNISEAARISGKDRKTLYRHMNLGVLTFKEKPSGGRVIDLAELMRVYPDTIVPGEFHTVENCGTDGEISPQNSTDSRHVAKTGENTVAMKKRQHSHAETIEMLHAQLKAALEREQAALDRERQAAEREKQLWERLNQSEEERKELMLRLLPPGQEMKSTPAQPTEATGEATTATESAGDTLRRSWWQRLFGA